MKMSVKEILIKFMLDMKISMKISCEHFLKLCGSFYFFFINYLSETIYCILTYFMSKTSTSFFKLKIMLCYFFILESRNLFF